MCGIFGLVAGAGLGLPQSTLERTVRGLFLLSEARGKEAAGLACLCRGQVDYFKCPERARDMLGRQGFQSFFAEALRRIYQDGRDGGQGGAGGFGLMGHSRLVTNGLETLARNNQPVVTAHTIGVHNGIIVNEGDLWRRHPDLVRDAEIDTKVLLSLLDKFRAQGDSEEDALRRAMAEMEGSASIAYFPDRGDLLVLATNTGSLYTAHSPAGGLFLFASEGMFLHKAIAEAGLDKSPGGFTFAHLAPGRGLLVEIASCAQRGFALGTDALGQRAVPAGPESPSPAGLTFLDRSASPAKMRRCTRCILPETFPHITFDKDGVCSVCHSYEYRQREGRQALEEFVAPYRSKNGEPDCIVAFSGGRDSSYGLHYVKKELGMNPIAFTYDWGMVTDLARRNQARICGKLGVEHIIRSPDIRFKRRNIRKNLQAWLHRPDLGMIPLFSAGDKQFYHYGRELRQATGVRLTVFCADEMERTEFKTGFCGVRESQHGQRLYAYSMRNKAQFIFYFMKQYLLNPRYINSSLVDTLMSYYSTYVAKDDFLYLFHYIEWEENLIVDTLVQEYGWELADDANTSWRIDDAFTPFHNYLYYTIAGFSEHDTFRSNQIRRGIISREDGLAMAQEANQPRVQAMREYAQMIGVNLEEVMLAVDAIPKLYER